MSSVLQGLWDRGHLKVPRAAMKFELRLRILTVELYYLAAWQDRVDPKSGLRLCKGQVFTNYSSLASRMDTTGSKIRTDLQALEKMGLLEFHKRGQGVLVSLLWFDERDEPLSAETCNNKESHAVRTPLSRDSHADHTEIADDSQAIRRPSDTKQSSSGESSQAIRTEIADDSHADLTQFADDSHADRTTTKQKYNKQQAVVNSSLPTTKAGGEREKLKAEFTSAKAFALDVGKRWNEVCGSKGFRLVTDAAAFTSRIDKLHRAGYSLEQLTLAMMALVDHPFHGKAGNRCTFPKFLNRELLAELHMLATTDDEPGEKDRSVPSRGNGKLSDTLRRDSGSNQPSATDFFGLEEQEG